ncbi:MULTISPECIES: Imm40 family immunity protein [unclassified Campylobacter]|uniref:Imm40 family immunity protein n=1 Tax=unclassified Campylobacter TaxID=2593542 RepID=UPI003D34558E
MLIDLDYLDILPEKLFKRGFFLREYIGVYEIGWKYSDIMEVLIIIKENKMIVFGGDVYELNNNKITITCDSWSFSGNDFVKSFEKAIEYIDNYHKNNGDNFIYSVVVEKR